MSIGSIPHRIIILLGRKAGSGRYRDQMHRLVNLLRQQQRDVCISSDMATINDALDCQPDAVVVAAGGEGMLALADRLIDGTDAAVFPLMPRWRPL